VTRPRPVRGEGAGENMKGGHWTLGAVRENSVAKPKFSRHLRREIAASSSLYQYDLEFIREEHTSGIRT
jgi:hypothetical protein